MSVGEWVFSILLAIYVLSATECPWWYVLCSLAVGTVVNMLLRDRKESKPDE